MTTLGGGIVFLVFIRANGDPQGPSNAQDYKARIAMIWRSWNQVELEDARERYFTFRRNLGRWILIIWAALQEKWLKTHIN